MPFDISIVIPAFNEAKTIGRLLETLAKQEGVAFEVLVVDGASTDGTTEIAAECGRSLPLSIRTFTTPRGRGRQMNIGASHAAAPYLLFLHADSDFASPVAIRDGLAALRTTDPGDGIRRAGRFGLLFGDAPKPHAGFYHYECKARLGRAGCIHGDQGFLFPAPFFHELGGFPEDLPVLEDTLLAEKVRAKGSWVLLPADIVTSARRFLTEGLAARQTVNAVIMNLGFIGYWKPMEKIREMYRVQGEAGRLDVARMVREIVIMIDRLPTGERERVWRETGRFVRDNAWQLAFARDTRRRFRAALPPEGTPGRNLHLFDKLIAPLLAQEPAARLATALVKVWSRVLGITDRVAEVRRRPPS